MIAAIVFDLRAGATAGPFHSLAAIYVGVSVAFGHRMIRWADERSLLLGMALLVGDPASTESLAARAALWTLILAIDFVWSFSYMFWSRKKKRSVPPALCTVLQVNLLLVYWRLMVE